ncbi:MAG: hypothetical protein LBF84_04135 [Holosporales bacterium]|nr:hypothetical protein [Holosporales bacterium]
MDIKKCSFLIVMLWGVFASGLEAASHEIRSVYCKQWGDIPNPPNGLVLPKWINRFNERFPDVRTWLSKKSSITVRTTDEKVLEWANAWLGENTTPEVEASTQAVMKKLQQVQVDGCDFVVTIADSHGNYELYVRILALVRALRRQYPNQKVIVTFTGDVFARNTEMARPYQPGLFSFFAKKLTAIDGSKVVLSKGNHEFQDPVHLALLKRSLAQDGIHFISNVSPFVRGNFVEYPDKFLGKWGFGNDHNCDENEIDAQRLSPVDPDDRWIYLKYHTDNTDIRLYGLELHNLDEARPICEHVTPFEQYHIEGNTLFFPHVGASGMYIGGGAPTIVPYVLDLDFWKSLWPLKSDKGFSRGEELWAQWAQEHNGHHHPMLISTARSLCIALKQLVTLYPEGPINLDIMSHATRIQTRNFFEPLCQAYGQQILDACGGAKNWNRLNIWCSGGHHHYSFDESTTGEFKEPADRGPYIINFALPDVQPKVCKYTAPPIYGPDGLILLVRRNQRQPAALPANLALDDSANAMFMTDLQVAYQDAGINLPVPPAVFPQVADGAVRDVDAEDDDAVPPAPNVAAHAANVVPVGANADAGRLDADPVGDAAPAGGVGRPAGGEENAFVGANAAPIGAVHAADPNAANGRLAGNAGGDADLHGAVAAPANDNPPVADPAGGAGRPDADEDEDDTGRDADLHGAVAAPADDDPPVADPAGGAGRPDADDEDEDDTGRDAGLHGADGAPAQMDGADDEAAGPQAPAWRWRNVAIISGIAATAIAGWLLWRHYRDNVVARN